MPPLVRLLLVQTAAGFLLGALVGAAFLMLQPGHALAPISTTGEWIGPPLIVKAFGNSFGIGCITTALFLPEDPRR